ncbi:RagB/SusD family nutrient uptake outer membrane protein [Filimonas effusa]|uniref:RagB/SusD family nutrient uptake outer membrane protein n=1 Tax=Filimonas effusa TaxID=2508721 RepID=A0A4V1M9X7_9BACT|nr:RagB/SusD family nutrient uptake outer membrane protein [Filimonas effusa]RXK83214.1 RagB/SusD family nutrient uptake outer membrane protein [Filimonas effusa]
MKQTFILLNTLLLVALLSSCNKFLEVKPKGIVIPEKLEDYENILNSREIAFSFAPELLYCTDDFYETFDALNITTVANAYYWRPGLDPNEKENPAVWGDLYKSVYHTNVIINNVLNASGGSEERKQSVLGEAWLVRADNYFTLLTIFAKAYDPATAAQDPGIPMVTSTDVTAAVPQRASVQTVLDTIISNLKRAALYMPTSNINRYRGTRYAAYGMLSRVYSYMHLYKEAGEYAAKALEAQHAILDLNNYADGYDMPDTDLRSDILWQRGSNNYSIPTFLLLSDELKTLFNNNDMRTLLFTDTNNNGVIWLAPSGWANFGITFQEMYLSRAEALARDNDKDGAMTIINNLRKKRIKPAAWTALPASTAEEALQLVLAERRRELAFGGLRWMDMKRLDQEGRMPEVKRVNRTTHVIEATLPPHGAGYVFEIPARVQQFNPGIQLNNR